MKHVVSFFYGAFSLRVMDTASAKIIATGRKIRQIKISTQLVSSQDWRKTTITHRYYFLIVRECFAKAGTSHGIFYELHWTASSHWQQRQIIIINVKIVRQLGTIVINGNDSNNFSLAFYFVFISNIRVDVQRENYYSDKSIFLNQFLGHIYPVFKFSVKNKSF